ncbi:MAG: 3-hydroxyacyl-CoA dehydrogenase family protein [Dehalococcoidales bacterium]|nr:MAG: 3-hydroxyacyl-CoA dehydrogenase family protein [Dehalococcoidales bacterium]
MEIDDIKKIGVVGAGTMGHGIALNFALGGYKVVLCDVNDDIIDRAFKQVQKAFDLFIEEKLIERAEAEKAIVNISSTTDLDDLSRNSDFITEAIVERSEDKRRLFNRLDSICPPETILASNTSWLILSDFASEVHRQNNIVITHYFAPPHIVPGVEVCGGPGTSPETYDLTCRLMEKIGKIPVRLRKERTGHLINRLQDAMRHEANVLWAEGVASAEDIELGIVTTCGFRMPFEGSMKHFDIAGMWRWPKDVLENYAEKEADDSWGLSPELVSKIRSRYAEGKPWFMDPDEYESEVEKRDRDLIRRLKALYRNKRE